MRSIYITFIQFKEADGISKKVMSQYQAFINCGLDMQLCSWVVRDGIKSYKIGSNETTIGNKYIAALRLNRVYNAIYHHIKSENIKFAYIRYTSNASYHYIKFLRRLKALGVVIYLEIPTYPYDGEAKPQSSFIQSCFTKQEKLFRNYLYQAVDRIVTFSSDPTILGIPCINISNAIDFNNIELRSTLPSHNCVKFMAVATLGFWHGYDRFIRAISSYYSVGMPLKSIYFDIVGKGPEFSALQQLTQDLSLEQFVTFHGRKEGAELTDLFSDADICVGSLGRHRSNVYEMKALKSVEYAARGIPFIYSENNPDFDTKPYVYKVSSDEQAISIHDILSTLQYQYYSPKAIRDSIFHLSWRSQIAIIVEQLRTT